FERGNYVEANQLLATAEQTEPDEPLVHAMIASMAYLEGDSGLEEVAARATLTKNAAQALLDSGEDPLRGHLYKAVGVFLEGAYILKTQGVARATPTALGMLQEVFSELDKAEQIDAADSELNLLKGYMDLMLAVNLPFADPAAAIDQMDRYGSPAYLTQRGIAIGYRDLGQYPEAIEAVDRAIADAPNNPELFYLKAQILARLDQRDESVIWFNKALEFKDQLPERLAKRIIWEGCIAEEKVGVNCADLMNAG
ncbi:MAG: Sll0314/Alr1548 family TPR repeat-containing protein, partial [Cyanobacteria bacterium J06632_3]